MSSVVNAIGGKNPKAAIGVSPNEASNRGAIA